MFSRASFVSLQHRNFRLLWIGLFISFSGSMMQNAVLLWHVKELAPPDQQAVALGLVGLFKVIPIVIFSTAAGVIADAWDRRRVILAAQVAATAVAAGLAALTFRGLTVLWPIYALAALGGAVGTFDMPARQALVSTLVPREHLPNAIGLNATMFQTASVVGPPVGAFVIQLTGNIAWAYVVNALSFGFVIVSLLMMRDVPVRAAGGEGTRNDVSLHAALEGLRFVFRTPLIRSTMLLDFFATFFASATALLPIFADSILGVGLTGYGWLAAAPAAGALVMSALMIAWTDRIERRGPVLIWAIVGHGLATVVFGVSRSFWLTFACLTAIGATDMVSTILRNIIRQLETPDRLRGRMTAVNMMFFMGGPQLGELEAGLVAQWIGPPLSVVTGGIGCLMATAWTAGATPALRAYRR